VSIFPSFNLSSLAHLNPQHRTLNTHNPVFTAASAIRGVLKILPFKVPKGNAAQRNRFAWEQGLASTVALRGCAFCHGRGMRFGHALRLEPCDCVFRSIFRICYNKFAECASQDRHLSQISVLGPIGQRKYSWSRKSEEYIADFELTARRILTEPEWRCFREHFVRGHDGKVCSERLGRNRKNFYSLVYRIEQKLGREFAEMKPYPLFPVKHYFFGPTPLDRDRAPKEAA
jgi:hypothetical protein